MELKARGDTRRHYSTGRLGLPILLLAAAGWVDAIAYLHFEQLFVSFMSGNSTMLAIDLHDGQWSRTLLPLVAIGSFVLGAFAGSLITLIAKAYRTPAVLSFVIILLLIALTLPTSAARGPVALVPLALAMGAQNATLNRPGGPGMGLTYVTGTLVRLGNSLAEAVCGNRGTLPWYFYAVMWSALIVGAVTGAVAYSSWALDALMVIVGVLGFVAAGTAAKAFHESRRE